MSEEKNDDGAVEQIEDMVAPVQDTKPTSMEPILAPVRETRPASVEPILTSSMGSGTTQQTVIERRVDRGGQEEEEEEESDWDSDEEVGQMGRE